MSEPTSRRRWLLLIVAAVVAAAAAAGIAVWLRPAPPPSLPDGLFLPSDPEGEFADDAHGFLLLGRCPTDPCETWVGATDDGGRSWRAATVPGLTFPRDTGVRVPRGRLIVLDATTAVIESYDRFPFGGPEHHRWYTSDGGRVWSEVPVLPETPVDELPDDAEVTVDTAGDLEHTLVVRLIRRDGSSAVLATPPVSTYPISQLYNEVTTTPDGARWFQGSGDNDLSVFVTRDRGRTWTELPLPAGAPEPGHGYRFHGSDGTNVYLTDQGAFRLWRSHDGGRSWSEIDVPFDNGGMDFGFSGYALPDGRLVVVKPVINGSSVQSEYLAIAPTGSSFEPVDRDIISLDLAPYFTSSPDFGVTGRDGSFTPMPFACRTANCR